MTASSPFLYTVALALVTGFALLTYRVLVRGSYRRTGRLTPLVGMLELLSWAFFFCMPYVYLPPSWWNFISYADITDRRGGIVGLIMIVAGLLLTFGTMFWFGLLRAMGWRVDQLIQIGPYKLSRNPQIVFGTLLLLGTLVVWPIWFHVGWLLLYGFISHIMIITEEEHLEKIFGEEYLDYRRRVPRYVRLPWRLNKSERTGG